MFGSSLFLLTYFSKTYSRNFIENVLGYDFWCFRYKILRYLKNFNARYSHSIVLIVQFLRFSKFCQPLKCTILGTVIPENRFDLAELLLSRFIKYPRGDGYLPFNYCVLSEAVPDFLSESAKSFLRPFCQKFWTCG